MKILNKITNITALLLIVVTQFVILLPVPKAYAATAPNMGVAVGYSVFGQTGVTNTGGTHMWGDVGENGAGDGSTAGKMDGTLFTIAQPTVVSAITSAYGDLAGQGLTGAIDLATSPTVGPGVYDIAATAFNSPLTLDGAGVYIFRSTSSIAQTAGGTMNLTNSACASNVFWQIPAAMTFAATGNIEGTIIAGTLISFVSGTSLKGRAWAETQVTLINNQITEPATCVSPTSTPTPTPTPTSSSSSSSSSSSDSSGSSGTTTYPTLASTVIAPTILESRRAGANSIFISWGPYSGVDTFNVQYGLENGKWLYNTNVTGFSTTINSLPSNQPIYIRVAARNAGLIGNYGGSKLVGGQIEVTNSNVLGVSFPNTGIGPKNYNSSEKNIPWNLVLPGSILIALFSYFLIHRKHGFSSRH